MSELIRKAVIELEPKLGKISDEDLVSSIGKEGENSDELLFFLLYGRMDPMLKALFGKFKADGYDFDDFMLVLLLKLRKNDFKALKNFKHKSTVKTYISNIAHNLLIDFAKTQKVTIDLESVYNQPCEDELDRERSRQLMELINTYPDPEIRFIFLKQLEGYDRKEIAGMLSKKRGAEVTPANVNTMFSRACHKLRSQVEESAILTQNDQETINFYCIPASNWFALAPENPTPYRQHEYSIKSIFRKMLDEIFE
jgi:RNA polymerase sigma factor (sigma-70 family)